MGSRRVCPGPAGAVGPRKVRAALAGAAVLALALAGCGLKSGSPMVDDVEPGSVGRGSRCTAPR